MWMNDKTSEALDLIVGRCFDLNRTFDRAVSYMVNVWAMPNAGDIIHHKLAHAWPLIADIVSDFKSEYNTLTFYPETHADGRTYTDLSDMMDTLLGETQDLYTLVNMAYKIAKENQDLNVTAMLQEFMRVLTKMIGQIITLNDKAKEMPTDYDTYDKHISAWGIVGVEL